MRAVEFGRADPLPLGRIEPPAEAPCGRPGGRGDTRRGLPSLGGKCESRREHFLTQATLAPLDAPFRFRGITPADIFELEFSLVLAMELNEAIRTYRPCSPLSTTSDPPEKVRAVLAAARLAPSQGNLQPWRFVVVQDDERKRLLAQACVEGKPVAEAPIAVVAFSVEEDVPVTIGGYISAYPLDVAVAIGHLQLAATSEGLGTSWIVDFHADKVRTVLGVPEASIPIRSSPSATRRRTGKPRPPRAARAPTRSSPTTSSPGDHARHVRDVEREQGRGSSPHLREYEIRVAWSRRSWPKAPVRPP